MIDKLNNSLKDFKPLIQASATTGFTQSTIKSLKEKEKILILLFCPNSHLVS